MDDFAPIDRLFIGISKAATGPFVYFYFRFAYFEPNVEWQISKLGLQNTVFALVALFTIYDFFYTILHWALHIKAIYGFVHKHHHRQLAPSRANVDAVNVHPFEYFLGEYNHLLALFLCSRIVVRVHVITSLLFLAIGGILAGKWSNGQNDRTQYTIGISYKLSFCFGHSQASTTRDMIWSCVSEVTPSTIQRRTMYITVYHKATMDSIPCCTIICLGHFGM